MSVSILRHRSASSLRRSVASGVAAVMLVLTVAMPAVAQDNERDERLAREYYERGAEAFGQENYAGALIHFRRAFEYKNDPVILYNISIAYVRIGNLDEALSAARRAEAMGGMSGDVRSRNSGRIQGLRAALNAAQVAGTASQSADKAAVNEAAEDREDQASAQLPESVSPTGEFGALGWTGVGLAAVGAGALTYAAVVDHRLGGDIAAFEDEPTVRQRQLLADRQAVGKTAVYAGASLVAIGAGLLVYDLLDVTEKSSVYLSPSPQSSGAIIRLRFRY